MSVLEVSSLSKWYGSALGVEDLSFTVEPGEIFGYLGPNGSGKTTTIRCMLGFLKASSGAMRIFGETVRAGRATQHQRIGYLPGDFRIWPDLTGRKALEVLGRLGGGSVADLRRRRQALAERLELNLDRRIRELSKGNRQKVGLLMAFHRGGRRQDYCPIGPFFETGAPWPCPCPGLVKHRTSKRPRPQSLTKHRTMLRLAMDIPGSCFQLKTAN